MEPVTLSVIASTAVAFLVPYLSKAGEAAAKKVGEDIYQAIKKRFSGKPAAEEALNDLEQTPDDEDLRAALRVQLKKLMAEDDEFAQELKQLEKSAGDTMSGATIIKMTAGDNAKQFGQVFGNVNFNSE